MGKEVFLEVSDIRRVRLAFGLMEAKLLNLATIMSVKGKLPFI